MTDFPTSKDDRVDNVDDAVADDINSLQDKVGIDNSAVTTTHDYKLSGVTGSDKAVSLTGEETLTNKTLTSPKLNENVALTTTATELNLLHNNLGVWTAFTPEIAGLTLGAGGTLTGHCMRVGKHISLRVFVKLGTSPTVGALTLTLPVTAADYGSTSVIIGKVFLLDSGTGSYVGVLTVAGIIYRHEASGSYVKLAGVSSTVPFTWTTNDEISITADYEAA